MEPSLMFATGFGALFGATTGAVLAYCLEKRAGQRRLDELQETATREMEFITEEADRVLKRSVRALEQQNADTRRTMNRVAASMASPARIPTPPVVHAARPAAAPSRSADPAPTQDITAQMLLLAAASNLATPSAPAASLDCTPAPSPAPSYSDPSPPSCDTSTSSF